MDTLSQIDSTQMVIKVISYEIDQKMNKIRVVEGRMPERENECLIEASSATNKLYVLSILEIQSNYRVVQMKLYLTP